MKNNFYKFICRLFLISIFFLFSSCIPYWDDGKVTGKTTIKNFEHLNDPLVIIADVMWEKTFLGLPCLDGVSYNRGNVFVVIDWETDTIFDWVYYPSNPGSVMKRAIELGTSPKKYYSSSYGGVVGCISPDSNKVTIYDTSDVHSYIEPSFFKGEKGIMFDYYENYPQTTCSFFDAEKEILLKDKIRFETESDITFPIEDDNGYLWISYEKKDRQFENLRYLAKIDCNNYTIDDVINFKSHGTDKVIAVKNGILFQSSVVNDYESIIRKYSSETGNLISEKSYSFPEDIDDGYLPSGFLYKDKLYIECFGKSNITNYYCVYVYQINTDTLEVERVSDRIDIWATENEWLRGSRIYFMYGNDSYTYFDLDTWEKAPYTYVMDYSTMTINPK